MKMLANLLLVLCLIALLTASPGGAHAQENDEGEDFDVDPVHSFVMFKVLHYNVGYVWGRFNEFEGEFHTAEFSPLLTATVQTGSIDTNHEQRDAHLRSADFFDVENHPTMTFRSRTIDLEPDNSLEVVGDLTLLGETRPVTFTGALVGEGEDPNGQYRMGFEVSAVVNRTDFGMDFMVGPIGEEIEIILAVEGIRRENE